MDTLTFIERMTASLAWPIAIAVVLILLRREIRTLLGQVTKLRFKDIEIDVAKDFSKTQAENTVALGADPAAEVDPQQARYLKLLAASPKTVIIENWRRIERAISQILIDQNSELGDEDFRSPIRLIDKLAALGILDERTNSVIRNMYLLRNRVVHFEPLAVSRADAETYYKNTLKMMGLLKEIDQAVSL